MPSAVGKNVKKTIKRIYCYLRKLGLPGHVNKAKGNSTLNRIEMELQRVSLSSYPTDVDIVPTKICNLNCIFCYRYNTKGPKNLSLSDFKTISDSLFPYARIVLFCGGGEPFLNKNFMEFLNICKKHKIDASITSNGTLLEKKICEEMIKNEYIKILNISLDGDRKETVESIRRGIDFGKVVDNVRLISDMKNRYRRENMSVNIRFTAMRRNIEELTGLVRHAGKWGVTSIAVNYLNVVNDIDRNESLFYHQELTKNVFNEASEAARTNKIQVYLPEMFGNRGSERQCSYPWKLIRIDPDGAVRFCYRAWNNPIGNILEENNFFDLWNNKHYQLLRKTVNTNETYFKYCSVCLHRKGRAAEGSHIKYLHNDLYEFDKKYEEPFNVKVPVPNAPYQAKDDRGVSIQ